MQKKIVTIEDLAGMVKRGFDEVTSDTGTLKKDVGVLKKDVGVLKNKVGNIETRVENIEKLLIKQHSDQIRSLDTRLKRLETLFDIKFQVK